jgi:hypothetical protein
MAATVLYPCRTTRWIEANSMARRRFARRKCSRSSSRSKLQRQASRCGRERTSLLAASACGFGAADFAHMLHHGIVCIGSRTAFEHGCAEVSSLCNCRHFAVHQRVRRGWRSLFEFCLLLSMAFPRRKLGTGPQTQECHKTHAG